MRKYSTISVPEEVKQTLEKNKGDKEWGEYLLELYQKAEEEQRHRAIERISEILSEEDFENMRKSSTKFREDFKIQ
jgi:predicted CopG family antitoxin